ncbi:superoxide dismutase, Cu-Zn [Parvularcula bermudensis HTCC2503]|uniref:Superoxide dismutase, Cu-Zn n=1 Tax=Parvularcula bermudensis (strain ATCC BAA-594 / HTCC2503 / KCTC 12087) TaxID=314260 RepID=E0TFH3_PARBH|nr:superoxide dismutase family protein [Parvularcula bermudensis]ADM10097.1 superoxide dismutase, Cu-Zn [Parvularcula bermudensis HTCC2503]
MPPYRPLRLLGASLALPLVACGNGTPPPSPESEAASPAMADHGPLAAAPGADALAADFIDPSGARIGTAFATPGPNGMVIRVDLEGLTQGFHAIHAHQVGDCSDPDAGFQASGGHINPAGVPHGFLNATGRSEADMPNIYAHGTGHLRAELFAEGLTADLGLDDDGFALIVHENPDDHETQPIGGAGGRVACAAFTN